MAYCFPLLYGHLQKFPNNVSGLLAYSNLVRGLERSCVTQAFKFYDRSFWSHRQTQNLPWGQMHLELWNKVVLMSLSSSAAVRSNTRPGSFVSYRKACYKYKMVAIGANVILVTYVAFAIRETTLRSTSSRFRRINSSVHLFPMTLCLKAVQWQSSSLIRRQGQGQTASATASLNTPCSAISEIKLMLCQPWSSPKDFGKSSWHYRGFQFHFKIPWWFIKYW